MSTGQKFKKEVKSQEQESRIPSQFPEKLLNHKAHKEHKDLYFYFWVLREVIFNFHLSFCFLIFNI